MLSTSPAPRKYDGELSTLLHDQLHWLNVPERLEYKLAVMVRRCMENKVQGTWSSAALRSPTSPADIDVQPTCTVWLFSGIAEAQSAVGPSLLMGVRRSGIHCLSNCMSRLSTAVTFVARWKLFFKDFQGPVATLYLVECCTPVTDDASRHRRSANLHRLTVPRYRYKALFSVGGPSVWNSLPVQLREPTVSCGDFRCTSKTILLRGISVLSAIEMLCVRLRYINLILTLT